MSSTPWLRSIGFCFVLSVRPATARADVIPPACSGATETAPCNGKAAGETCSFTSGGQGNCAALRCTTDGGQAVLQCVATGASSGGGCSTVPGAASTAGGLTTALLLFGLALRRARTFLAA